jgi:hypothetical protein
MCWTHEVRVDWLVWVEADGFEVVCRVGVFVSA